MTGKCCKYSRVLFPLGSGLQTLGLALMVGGMLALGAFTAPAVFGHFSRESAAPVMAQIFRRYDMVLLVAMILVWVGEMLRWRAGVGFRTQKTFLGWVRYGLLVALTGGLLYSTQVLNTDIERMNRSGLHRDYATAEGQRFEKVHKLSEGFYKLELLGAVLLILLTPFATQLPEAKTFENPGQASDHV